MVVYLCNRKRCCSFMGLLYIINRCQEHLPSMNDSYSSIQIILYSSQHHLINAAMSWNAAVIFLFTLFQFISLSISTHTHTHTDASHLCCGGETGGVAFLSKLKQIKIFRKVVKKRIWRFLGRGGRDKGSSPFSVAFSFNIYFFKFPFVFDAFHFKVVELHCG